MDHQTLQALIVDLASEDPRVRDDHAYTRLVAAIGDGALAGRQRASLLETMSARLSDPHILARSFAALILAALAATWSDADGPWPEQVTDTLCRWWVSEADQRGYDERVGWVHAVAHGADAIGELGAAGLADAARLLATVGERLVAPTEFVWHDMEEDRIAAAICQLLTAAPGQPLEPLLRPVADYFATGEPGPMPAPANNAAHVLRTLYVALGQRIASGDDEPGALPDAARLQRAVAETLQPISAPWWTAART